MCIWLSLVGWILCVLLFLCVVHNRLYINISGKALIITNYTNTKLHKILFFVKNVKNIKNVKMYNSSYAILNIIR